MQVINAANVSQALGIGLRRLQLYGEKRQTRNGEAVVMPQPVTTVYHEPRNRVITSPVRDANPFFHLVEAAWMLDGGRDVGILEKFISNFGKYSDDGDYLHGAYGWRWRENFRVDQITEIVERLIKDPEDRAAVLTMWDPDAYGSDDLRIETRDRPCNTHIYFRRRGDYLDLTVCCRSNDAVWGAHGANAVHFSILLEYVAGLIGVGVGKMYQISNNYHAYTATLEPILNSFDSLYKMETHFTTDVVYGGVAAMPIGRLDRLEIHNAVEAIRDMPDDIISDHYWMKVKNDWLRDVMRAAEAYQMRRRDMTTAIRRAGDIHSPDWRIACTEWLERRIK